MLVKILILLLFAVLGYLLIAEVHRFLGINFKLRKEYYPEKLKNINSYQEYLFSVKPYMKPYQSEITNSEMNTEKIRYLESKLVRHIKLIFVYTSLILLLIVALIYVTKFGG